MLWMVACQKETAKKTTADATASIKLSGFHISESRLVLLQGNASHKALRFTWETNGCADNAGTHYTIEAALNGAGFDDTVELATTTHPGVQVTVQELNKKLSHLILPGNTATVAMRIKAQKTQGNTVVLAYTEAEAVQVTTYIDYVDYPNYIRVPGNYENWVVHTAPKIVSPKANGIYEGYINFSIPYPQFLFVKGDTWGTANTFMNIGAGKIGFGGDIAGAKEGAGIYLVKVNTNTNQWQCTKIRAWGIHGTAVEKTDADPVMSYDAEKGLYTLALSLQKGNFRFRANGTETLTLGFAEQNGYRIPDAAGADFVVEKAGLYQLMLDVKIPGNYTCNVVRNPLAVTVNTKP